MTRYEYKVVPAPGKAAKVKGVKSPEGRFAHSIEAVLNEMAADGWEFQRAELLPSEERSGLTGKTTNWRNLLVFRREAPAAADPLILASEDAVDPEPAQDDIDADEELPGLDPETEDEADRSER